MKKGNFVLLGCLCVALFCVQCQKVVPPISSKKARSVGETENVPSTDDRTVATTKVKRQEGHPKPLADKVKNETTPAPESPTPAPKEPLPSPMVPPVAPAPESPTPTPKEPLPSPMVPPVAPAPESPTPAHILKDDPSVVDEEPLMRNIVLFEFTGQSCGACPYETKRIKEKILSKQSNVIPVVLHINYLKGELYRIQAHHYFPRSGRGTPLTFYNAISNSGYTEGGYDQKSTYKLTVDLQRTDMNLTLKVKPQIYRREESKKNSRKLALLVWITEDKIIAPQYNGRAWQSDYQHDFIFRESLTEQWGTPISLGEEKTIVDTLGRRRFESRYGIHISKYYEKMENCHAVVMLVDQESKEILEAKKVPLK